MEYLVMGDFIWIGLIIFSCTIILSFYFREKNLQVENYRNDINNSMYFKLLLMVNFPWLLMGFGLITGMVPSFKSFFRPQDGNLFVIIWFFSIILIWGIGFCWVAFCNGAERFVKKTDVLNIRINKPSTVIWLFLTFIGGCLLYFGIFFMFVQNFDFMSDGIDLIRSLAIFIFGNLCIMRADGPNIIRIPSTAGSEFDKTFNLGSGFLRFFGVGLIIIGFLLLLHIV